MEKPDILEVLKLELLLRERNCLTWITKDGTKIPISKLDTQHLVNIINMLEKNSSIKLTLEEEELDAMGDYYTDLSC